LRIWDWLGSDWHYWHNSCQRRRLGNTLVLYDLLLRLAFLVRLGSIIRLRRFGHRLIARRGLAHRCGRRKLDGNHWTIQRACRFDMPMRQQKECGAGMQSNRDRCAKHPAHGRLAKPRGLSSIGEKLGLK
jgi:hypothetical protein